MRLSKYMLIILILALAIPLAQPSTDINPALAQSGVTATVSDNLNVRQIPGLNAPILGSYDIGTQVTVDGREDQLGNGGIWVFVTPVNGGTTGWVLQDYLIFSPGFVVEDLPVIDAAGIQSETGSGGADSAGGSASTASAINFRQAPSLNAPIITTLAAGTRFEPLARTPNSTWVKANVNGTEGWLYASLVYVTNGVASLPAIEAETVAAAVGPEGSIPGSTVSAVNFRRGPSLSAGIITTLSAGTPVAFTGRNSANTWFRGVVNGTEGWLYYTLVSISGNANSLEIAAQEQSASAPVTTTAAYSSANLGVFSYGAHVAGFNNLGLMQYAGMSWIKTQIRYGRGADPGGVCGTVNNAHANGFRILLGVVGAPGDVTSGQSYFNDFGNFVAGLAACGADAIEIWNEPNLDREWATGYLDPALYTQLLATSYNAIKGANPSTIVISAALAPTGAESAFGRERVWNDDAFLIGMRNAGAGRYMDCVGAHYNEGIISPYQTSGDPRGGYYTRYLYGMTNTYYNIMRKPICYTELGYLSPEGYGPLPGNFSWASGTSVAEHAQWVADAVRIGRSDSRVAMIIIWNFNFTGTYGDDPMGGYAMIRPDGSCPACDRLAGR